MIQSYTICSRTKSFFTLSQIWTSNGSHLSAVRTLTLSGMVPVEKRIRNNVRQADRSLRRNVHKKHHATASCLCYQHLQNKWLNYFLDSASWSYSWLILCKASKTRVTLHRNILFTNSSYNPTYTWSWVPTTLRVYVHSRTRQLNIPAIPSPSVRDTPAWLTKYPGKLGR